MAEKIIYFGTDRIVENPDFDSEDFCYTEDIKKAKERAGSYMLGGILNIYAVDQDDPGCFRFLGYGPVDSPEKGKRKKASEPETEEPLAGRLCVYLKQVRHEEPENFFRLFRISGLQKDWDESGRKLCAKMEPGELYSAVLKRLGMTKENELPEEELPSDEKTLWAGNLLDYIQRKTGKSFSSILEDISFHELEVLYEPLKAFSAEQSFQVIREKIRQKGKKTWIQRIRRRRGLSQRELAEKSGVNLRTLQQYEIRDKDIEKAAAGKLLAMARVLSCRPEELMEW